MSISLDQICVCIPVRYGSSRLPGKPLLTLYGGTKTVIEVTLEKVLQSQFIRSRQIYVLTDDHRIETEVLSKFQGARELGGVVMTSKSCPNALYRIVEALDQIPARFRAIINLHGDEPGLNPLNLDALISNFILYQKSSLLVRKLSGSLDQVEIKSRGTVKAVMDRQKRLMYCGRAVIPHNKSGQVMPDKDYFGVIGLQVLRREDLAKYVNGEDQGCDQWLYQEEDVEELKWLELGVEIRCAMAQFPAERSLNTAEDYQYFLDKYA